MRTRIFLTYLLNLSLRSTSYAIFVTTVGILGIGLATNFLWHLIVDGTITFRHILALVLTVVLFAVAYLIFRINHRTSELIVTLNEKSGLDPKPILITGLSPYRIYPNGGTNLDVVINLIKKNDARTVYLVSVLKRENETGEVYAHTMNEKDREGVLTAYQELLRTYPEKIDFQILHVPNTDSSQQSYRAVAEILASLTSNNLLSEVCVDVTPGTKAMSVGMSAAAIQFGTPLTYLATPRDERGEPDHDGVASVITTLYSDDLKRAILATAKTE